MERRSAGADGAGVEVLQTGAADDKRVGTDHRCVADDGDQRAERASVGYGDRASGKPGTKPFPELADDERAVVSDVEHAQTGQNVG